MPSAGSPGPARERRPPAPGSAAAAAHTPPAALPPGPGCSPSRRPAYGADGQKGIIDQISEIDTLDKVKRENIDKVSHATFSSNSIIEAIEKCLEQAKES